MHSQKIIGNQFAAEVVIPDPPDGPADAPSTGPPSADSAPRSPRRWSGLRSLLQPHTKLLAFGLVAVVGEGAANLLEPWPLKLAFDSFQHGKAAHGWLYRWLQSIFGSDKVRLLEVAAVAVLVIAVLDAVCFFAEKYLTTSVGQWVMHDLRRLLYAHLQHLSLDYHKNRQTGELISRLTTDIDSIQSFIV